MKTENENNEEPLEGKKNLLEWSVFAISLLLVLAIISYLAYKTMTHQTSPPSIQVTYTPSPSGNAAYRYHLLVRNIGGETAEEVVIEVVLMKNEKAIEKSEVQFPFVPKASKRESWVNFSNNPALADTIVARVMSFKKP